MELSDSQKSSVAGWVQEGLSIADIQRKLNDEFQISMTYMDVRFLVDDLDVAVIEPEALKQERTRPTMLKKLRRRTRKIVDEGGTERRLRRCRCDHAMGALVSGTVRFSDGKSLGWQLGATGQLRLILTKMSQSIVRPAKIWKRSSPAARSAPPEGVLAL